jgi:hypothetical protein
MLTNPHKGWVNLECVTATQFLVVSLKYAYFDQTKQAAKILIIIHWNRDV